MKVSNIVVESLIEDINVTILSGVDNNGGACQGVIEPSVRQLIWGTGRKQVSHIVYSRDAIQTTRNDHGRDVEVKLGWRMDTVVLDEAIGIHSIYRTFLAGRKGVHLNLYHKLFAAR